LLANRVTAIDGITSPNPPAAAVPTIYADLNGLHTALNQLVLLIQTQLNQVLSNVSQIQGTSYAPQYTFATLPSGVEGQISYVTNGRKVGEGVGVGTGVPVYFSNGLWRVYSTDTIVQA
jgi:hypothetical protein